MKKFLILLAMMLVITTSISAIVIDLKINAEAKGRLAGFEIGIMYYLNCNNINVFDIGEDYAVWVELVSEKKINDARHYLFNIEITRPSALFKSKEILAEIKNVKIVLPAINGSVVSTTDESMLQLARKKAIDLKDQTLIECQFGGKVLTEYIIQLLKNIKN